MAEEQKEAPTADAIPKISVFTPIIYVSVLLGVFVVFSIYYRRKRLRKLQQFEPLFGQNKSAELYEFMKIQYNNPDVPKEQKPHEKVMKAALLRRAVEAVRRSMKLKEFEPTFTKLYQEGLIGDDIFQQYGFQTKFQELELQEIVKEVETYKKGWVQTFFPTAQEICFNEALRRRLTCMDERKSALSELWQYHVSASEEKLSKQEQQQVKAEIVKEGEQEKEKLVEEAKANGQELKVEEVKIEEIKEVPDVPSADLD